MLAQIDMAIARYT